MEEKEEKGKKEAAAKSTAEQESMSDQHNVFDYVFRTMIEYLPELIIPLINEAFHTDYPQGTPVVVRKNEHYTRGKSIVTDLFVDLGGRLFHVECQSTTDGRMIIRVMEYAMSIALENASKGSDGVFTVEFPSSCVIYLRSTKDTPDELVANVKFPDGQSVLVHVPLLKVKEYSTEQIFKKNLLMFLPYYLMRYENDCKEADKLADEEKSDEVLSTFMSEFKKLLELLPEKCNAEEQQYMVQLLLDLTIVVAGYLAPESKKGEFKLFWDVNAKPRAQLLKEVGIEEGEKTGEEKRAREVAERLHQRGDSLADIAELVGCAVEQVQLWLGPTSA